MHLLTNTTVFAPNTTVYATNTTAFVQNTTICQNTAVFVTIDLFISKYLLGSVKLELSVLILSRTVEGGHLLRLFPNVNSETAKYTSPRMLGSVYLAVSLLTLG